MDQTKEVVFDDNGATVEEIDAVETQETEVEAQEGTVEEVAAAPASGKYKIGDKTFSTQEEALAYAESQVELEKRINDAYRQGQKDLLSVPGQGAESVTPQTPKLDTEELYTNPDAFLEKFAHKIKSETRSELEQKEAIKTQSDQIWNEFTERHPSLADFRKEVEQYVEQDMSSVRAIIGSKGRPASYDYIATKLKSRFEAYANAVKPKRELPNGGGGASPSSKSSGVTPKVDTKKPLSFADQMRTLRKKTR